MKHRKEQTRNPEGANLKYVEVGNGWYALSDRPHGNVYSEKWLQLTGGSVGTKQK